MAEQITNGGMQYVPQLAAVQQIICLDFDGETTSYNGEILSLDNVEVETSSLTEERINNIVTFLNEKYASQNVVFVTERPQSAEYSTIFIGKTTAFDSYGTFAGLAETIDEGNANKTDKAFVNLDSTATDTEIISTIAHETDHLTGTLNHGGEGLQAYAYGYCYDVSSGITSSGITLNYDSMYVYDRGTATNTTVNRSYLQVSSGGTANNTTVNSGGWLWVSSGGTATDTTVNYWGYLQVFSGGTATDTMVNGGYLQVFSGGTATDTTVNNITPTDRGNLQVFSGGTATDTTVDGGELYVYDGGTATDTKVDYYGALYVSFGGTATSTTVNSGGDLYVFSGGTATEVRENGGYVDVANGANVTFVPNTISGLVLSYYTSATLHSGTTATATTVNGYDYWWGGHLYVYDGGTATSTTVNSWGYLYVSSGGTANNTTVNSSGYLRVYSGGTANNTTVNSGGRLDVYTYGMASNVIISQGHAMIHSSATLQGEVTLGGTMNIAYETDTGGLEKFTFVLDEESDTSARAMLDNIAALGDFDNFHISVTSDLAGGRYKLAGNAENFSQDVTLTVNGASAGVFQWSDGEYNSILIGEEYYTLKLDRNMNLCLRPTSNISLSYSIDTIDQIVYYGLRGEEFDGVVMKVPYFATATITVDNDIPDGIYEFVSELEEIEGAELEFQIEVIGGIPVYLSTNKQMCINGTKISENADTSTWKIDVDDFILTEKIKQSMTVTPIPQYGASIGTFIPPENTESKDVTLIRNSDHSDANKNILGSGIIKHSHIINGQVWQITLEFIDNSVWIYTKKGDETNQFSQDTVWVQEGSKLEVKIKIPAAQKIIPLELLENPQTPPESYNLTCTFDVSEDDFGNKELITKEITISDTQIKNNGTLRQTLDCKFVPSQDLNCWIAVAANILHDGGYIVDVSAQKCFEYWSERYLLSRKASQTDSIKRVLDDFGIGSVWANLSGNIETGLKHLSKNPTNIACLTITDGKSKHGVTCHSVDLEGKSVTVADSDRYLTGIILTNYRITQDPENGKWYIQSYAGEGKDWEITGIESVIPKIEGAPTLDYTQIKPDRLSDKIYVKTSYGAISQGSVTTVSGSVWDAVVLSGGTLEIASGAVGDTITLNNMAALKLNSGASVHGEIFTNGGTISTEEGIDFADDASINFDLTLLEGQENAMLDDLAHVAGVALTVTVEAFQAEGRYVLANGVADFDGEITVHGGYGSSYTLKLGFFIGELGTLSVGDELKIGNQLYSLDIENDSLVFTVSEAPLAVWDISADTTCLTESSVTVTAIFSDDVTIKEYSLDGETWNRYDDAGVVVSGNGTLYFRGADANGDYSDVATYDVNNIIIRHNGGSADGVTLPAGHDGYLIEYSKDNFENYLQIETDSGKLNTYGLAAGSYNWQFWAQDTSEWWLGNDIVVTSSVSTATNWTAQADGNTDLFFANAKGCWKSGFFAQHQGFEAWEGTAETCALAGKNKLADIFTGSEDANILVLTDDANGDALFVDDIYTALGDQARFSQIDEIRAGAGDDIVDMTSERYAYEGNGITVYGGSGNDTIWGGAESNTLFGDAGNDRLVGGSGNDVIAGGSGSDSMHGGGGDDIFTFGADWGNDTVEQLASGSVTLWFESGSEDNWNSETLTYSDGVNTVTVSGVTEVTLKFGDEAPVAGAFLDGASEKVFEDKNKGFIA